MELKDSLNSINSEVKELINKKNDDLESLITKTKDIISFVKPDLTKYINITNAKIRYNKDYVIESIFFAGGYDADVYVRNDGIYAAEYTYANNESPSKCIYKF